ncbi:MAG TPA: S-methyl-5-thioribose-1-phosphate isomerase [Thermoanaerobaculia bacterium]|nr:S-methyl-5-thioribose-1-phosphate isomerase [Thermoanaerobaculia bacterium]
MPQDDPDLSPLRLEGEVVHILDQTLLPAQERWLECREPEDVADAIRRLAVRGAPAIGVAAAYALALGARAWGEDEATLERTYRLLVATRPTAVNLRWALDQGRALWRARLAAGEPVAAALFTWAAELHRRDIVVNRRLGEHGARLFGVGDRVLTHCNAGALATGGYGTALGVVRAAWSAGALSMVWVDETRPLLQGARLTAWELAQLGIPHRLVTDSSAGALMARGLVERVVVGADRIAANGDVANKIGTYTVAVLAQRHGVPFYVAAPRSTLDPATATGADIPIEERAPVEVTTVGVAAIAPAATEAANFAFDVTPHDLVTAIITEVGVLEAPYEESIARALALGDSGNPASEAAPG